MNDINVAKTSWSSPKTVEVAGRMMQFDTLYIGSNRGVVKVMEIVLCFISMLLVGYSQPVHDERGLALFVTSSGIILSFVVLLSYILTLNTRIHSTSWFIVEVTYYVLMIIGLFLSALFMVFFSASHWADINPTWQTVPSLAAGALSVCMVIYIIDLSLFITNWKRYSWRPSLEDDQPQESVLPQ